MVLVLQDLEFGGTQRYAINVLKRLNRNLFDPELWVLRSGMDMAPLAHEACDKVRWLSHSRNVGPIAIVNLFRAIMKNPPDILYTLTGVPNIWGRPFGRLFGVPVVISSWRGLVEKQWESILWRLSSRIVCNAGALKLHLMEKYSIDSDRIAVVPNAVNAEFFCPNGDPKAQDPTLISVGRFVVEKDHATLLEAFRLASQRIPNARLILVGDGHLKHDVEEQIRARSIERVTIFPGRPDNRDLLRQSWAFTMSSIREGSPNVILEAMSTGLPFVGTAVGGIPELVENGKTGLLVPPKDPQALADAMIALLHNEQLRRQMGGQARDVILSKYSMESMMEQTEALLLEAVREAGLEA
jgi:glycosyltransferase involved in cell wall biosynthesis